MSDEEYSPAKMKPPASLLEFVEYLAPVFKYYLLLLVVYLVAKRINRALDEEAQLQEKEYIRQRPNLSTELMRKSSSEEEEGSSEEEDGDKVDEELVTDGSRLVKVPGEAQARERKPKKKDRAAKDLFEGLQQIEKELREDAKQGKEANVSWNELHMGMLRRYKDKFPDQGPRVAGADDDYDDEFKELLQKHNIKPDAFKMHSQEEGAAAVDTSGKGTKTD